MILAKVGDLFAPGGFVIAILSFAGVVYGIYRSNKVKQSADIAANSISLIEQSQKSQAASLARADLENESLREKVTVLEKSNREQSSRIEVLEKDNHDLREEVAVTQQKCQKCNDQLESLRDEVKAQKGNPS